MEIIKVNNQNVLPIFETEDSFDILELDPSYSPQPSREHFMNANTEVISFEKLRRKCVIPVFAKDNESTISHPEFINAIAEAAQQAFRRETVMMPAVRVSHPIKGRVPEAMGKPANQLAEYEKTLYYERMAFVMEIPSIHDVVSGNKLSLTVGGVRAYNLENLNRTKSEEKFKLFIGFNNWVCCNLCISTDGFKQEIRARSPHELVEQAYRLFSEFQAEKSLKQMKELTEYSLSEPLFAQMVGRARMYPHLPAKMKRDILPLELGDSQVNMVVKDYFNDESFCRNEDGNIDLWKLYNLFTGANKNSYVDSFLDRNVSVFSFTRTIMESLKNKREFWFLS
jgi:hypothetical protein